MHVLGTGDDQGVADLLSNLVAYTHQAIVAAPAGEVHAAIDSAIWTGMYVDGALNRNGALGIAQALLRTAQTTNDPSKIAFAQHFCLRAQLAAGHPDEAARIAREMCVAYSSTDCSDDVREVYLYTLLMGSQAMALSGDSEGARQSLDQLESLAGERFAQYIAQYREALFGTAP